MEWNKTIASHCRYGEIAERIWGEWEILWEDSEADYQGHATILAQQGERFAFYEWWYGSCSGCDAWEDELDDDGVEAEMRNTAMWFESRTELETWLLMLEGRAPISGYDPTKNVWAAGIDALSGGMRDRVSGVRMALGLPPLPGREEKTDD